MVSINDRLGALLDATSNTTASETTGQNITALDNQWIYDLVTLQKHEADEMKRIEEEEEERRYEDVQNSRHPDFG